MKPNRPYVLFSTRNYIRLGWETSGSLILDEVVEDYISEYKTEKNEEVEEEKRWYVLERKDRTLGWCPVYRGFKAEAKVGPLSPGDFYEFRLKIKSKGKESEWSDSLFAATKDDFTPLPLFHRVVENGPVTSLKKILSERMALVNVPNKYGQPSLNLTIRKNNVNFMGVLINHKAEIEYRSVGSGRTPLMEAAARGYMEAVQLLLEKGASWHTKDKSGLSPLNYAIDNSQLDIVRLAVDEGADLHSRDTCNWTPLMRGIILKSSLEVLTYLLNNGSDPNDFDDKNQTALMQAVLSGRQEVVELLVEKGANILSRNVCGRTAYDLAKHSSNEEITKALQLLEFEENVNDLGSRKNSKKKREKSE